MPLPFSRPACSSEKPALSRRDTLAMLAMLATGPALAQTAPGSAHSPVKTLRFDDRDFHFRFANKGLYEFTPEGESDLKTWRNMVTINLHRQIQTPEHLAQAANNILGNSRQLGRVMKAASKPATPTTPAEHMIVAVLGQPGFLEAAFTRLFLHRSAGIAITYSYRIYQEKAGPAMSEWLNANGNRLETVLVRWSDPRQIDMLLAA